MKKGIKRPLKWFIKHLDGQHLSETLGSNLDVLDSFITPDIKRGTKSWENALCCYWGQQTILKDGSIPEEDLVKYQREFFLNSKMRPIRKGLLTEIGRCYITAFMYEVEEHHYEMMGWLYNTFYAHKREGIKFPHLEYTKLFRKIRQNYAYYFKNKDELKVLLIKGFFKDKAESLLPQKSDVMKMIEEYSKEEDYKGTGRKNLIRIIKFWREYSQELQSTLDNYGVPYLTEKEFKKKVDDEINELNEIYNVEYEEYMRNVKFTLEGNADKLLKS